MKTKPLTKSELIRHLEHVVFLLKDDSSSQGTISWEKTPLGTYETIALVQYTEGDGNEELMAIGDVND